MPKLDRYTADEKKTLAKLVAANKQMPVPELAELVAKQLPGRSADALKQRIFRVRREIGQARGKKGATPVATPRRPAKKAVRRKTKAGRARSVGGFVPGEIAAEGVVGRLPGPAVLPARERDELTLELLSGARVHGSPAKIAELVKAL